MPSVVSVEEHPVRDIKARRFRASSFIDDAGVLLRVATERALAWAEQNAETVDVERIEYEYHDNCNQITSDPNLDPDMRLLGAVFDSSWTVDAIVYYYEGTLE